MPAYQVRAKVSLSHSLSLSISLALAFALALSLSLSSLLLLLLLLLSLSLSLSRAGVRALSSLFLPPSLSSPFSLSSLPTASKTYQYLRRVPHAQAAARGWACSNALLTPLGAVSTSKPVSLPTQLKNPNS